MEKPYCFEYAFRTAQIQPGFTKELSPEFVQFQSSNSDIVVYPLYEGYAPCFPGHNWGDAENFYKLDWSEYEFTPLKNNPKKKLCFCTETEPCDYHRATRKE